LLARRLRIARGSGTTTTEVNGLLDRFKEMQTYMFQVVPGRSTNLPVVVLAQNKLVATPPMRRLAVPPVTVPKAWISSGNADGHVEGVTTVVVSVPVVVFPVLHVTAKVLPVPICVARPPEILRWLHPFALPVLPVAVALPVNVLQLTIVGLVPANAEVAGKVTRSATGTATSPTNARRTRRIFIPLLFRSQISSGTFRADADDRNKERRGV
jgi:hypothetical protein